MNHTPLNDRELRREAEYLRDQHDPPQQEDNPYNRCAHCHYTRHPCDVYDLAVNVLVLLDRLDKMTPSGDPGSTR